MGKRAMSARERTPNASPAGRFSRMYGDGVGETTGEKLGCLLGVALKRGCLQCGVLGNCVAAWIDATGPASG